MKYNYNGFLKFLISNVQSDFKLVFMLKTITNTLILKNVVKNCGIVSQSLLL